MKFFNRFKKAYIIHETSNNKFMLCKVLNEYTSDKEATETLIQLLRHTKTEKDILKEFSNK